VSAKGIAKNEELEKLLSDELGVTELGTDTPALVDGARHFELAKRLKELGYRIYVSVVATHFPAQPASKTGPEQPEHYEVVTLLRSPGAGSKLAAWRVNVPMGEKIRSLVELFAGADWQEREQYDLVGVEFEGHPDLRRLMLPEDWEGHPLRKDYAIDTRCPPWR
jgi:NADH:ubiquinone oxidoreductase subunit C